ncbi:sigma factor-like helix-turn-helix DNA-binding protein [Synechococcus sp. UW105]|uniref:sigma factor-like helix-turn-helix DNA-binding protein n=1 Tax=Synechococcus sp. UW105 TaxID=337067 RepID=UPI00352AD6E1
MHQAMRQLPDHARQLLIRHYVLGETVRQIGRQKGLSHVEVRTVLRQSLQVLQEMAAGRDGVGDQPRC